MVMIDFNPIFLRRLFTADKIKSAQKPCQNKPSQVSQTDEVSITKPNDNVNRSFQAFFWV